jgi:hypothetical protein
VKRVQPRANDSAEHGFCASKWCSHLAYVLRTARLVRALVGSALLVLLVRDHFAGVELPDAPGVDPTLSPTTHAPEPSIVWCEHAPTQKASVSVKVCKGEETCLRTPCSVPYACANAKASARGKSCFQWWRSAYYNLVSHAKVSANTACLLACSFA